MRALSGAAHIHTIVMGPMPDRNGRWPIVWPASMPAAPGKMIAAPMVKATAGNRRLEGSKRKTRAKHVNNREGRLEQHLLVSTTAGHNTRYRAWAKAERSVLTTDEGDKEQHLLVSKGKSTVWLYLTTTLSIPQYV